MNGSQDSNGAYCIDDVTLLNKYSCDVWNCFANKKVNLCCIIGRLRLYPTNCNFMKKNLPSGFHKVIAGVCPGGA